MLPGADQNIIRDMMQGDELPSIQAMTGTGGFRQIEPQKGIGNYQPMREVLCEEQLKDHSDLPRHVPRKHSYTNLGFERPYMMTGPFFGERHILDGRNYALLGVSDVNFREMPGLTMISQWLCHAQNSEVKIYPEALRRKITADSRFKDYQRSLERHSVADALDAEKILHFLSERLEHKLEVFSRIIARGDWDCVVTSVDELHEVGHLLWHFWDTSHPLYQVNDAHMRDRIKDMYRLVDRKLGELFELVGPVPVVLVGGPGMQANGSLNSQLDTLLRRFEEVYTGKAIADAAHNKERLFYAQYTDPAGGGIRLNLQGREPNGLVSEAQYDELCQYLIECFSAIHNCDTGQAVSREIYISREHYGVSRDSVFPDLLCIWEPGSAYGSIRSEQLGTVKLEPVPDNVLDFRTGDHDGVMWVGLNELASAYMPEGEMLQPYELATHFRRIVETFT